MELEICKDENEWVTATNRWVTKQFARNPSCQRVFVPAGDTPRPLYRSWQHGQSPLPARADLVQLDEVLDNNAPFQRFFRYELPAFQSRIEYIDEAERGADIALLGLGLNGHVAFHEPGLPKTFYSGCLRLDPDTCARLNLPNHSKAVSYGVGAMMRARAIAVLVRGPSKRQILARVLKREADCPASWLCEHPNIVFIADAAAAA